MYVCMYVLIYVRTYVCIYVCMYVLRMLFCVLVIWSIKSIWIAHLFKKSIPTAQKTRCLFIIYATERE